MKTIQSRDVRIRSVRIAAACAAYAALAVPLAAQPAADFFKGKQLKFVVASDPGGGYDVYARVFADYWKRHIPGSPNIIVQNMQGAGGVVAANWLYNIAPKDGTVVSMQQRGVPFLALFGKQGPKFDPVKFNWLGSLNNETGVITLWHTAPVKTIEDAMKQEAILGGSGPNDTESYPALMNNTIGTKFRIISGYPSTTGITLAMERGEVQGLSQSWGSLKAENPNWIRDKKMSILVQVTSIKSPDLPDVPTIMEYVKDPEHRAIWNIMLTQKAMGRPLLTAPGVPADRVALLRKSFDDTVADKTFVSDMEHQRRDLTPVAGVEIQRMLTEVASQPKALLAKVDAYTTYRGAKQMVKIERERHTGKVVKVGDGGRAITVDAKGKAVTAEISGSRTKLTVGGKDAKRDALKEGMTCTIVAPAGAKEAEGVDCEG
jgi:tripartite-type tricarboxylate transporter receptor subunit TctC